MATKMLTSSEVAAFCESTAVMYSAGIQIDEAIALLGENMHSQTFGAACESVYAQLIAGNTLTDAMRKARCFPQHALNMVAAGEHSGRLEATLWSLSRYYAEEDRIQNRVRSAVGYPAALLCLMTIILAFTVTTILPVFEDVYAGLAGDLGASPFSYITIAQGIGYLALGVTLVCTVVVLVCLLMGRSPEGAARLMRLMEHLPLTREPLRQMAISRFTAALATYIAAGIDSNTAMEYCLDMVSHKALRKQLDGAYASMIDPDQGKSLAQAIYDSDVLDPIYARMLVAGVRSGNIETVLSTLSEVFFEDSTTTIDRLINNVEPALAAFLTVSVGASLISIMLPLIGIMGSIG